MSCGADTIDTKVSVGAGALAEPAMANGQLEASCSAELEW